MVPNLDNRHLYKQDFVMFNEEIMVLVLMVLTPKYNLS